MRNLFLILPLLVLVASSSAKACGTYGCDYSGWGGLYNTGDFNLYSFGSDLYGLGGYGGGYSDYGYGGGCGTFSGGCGGGYDSAGLYGSDFGMGGFGGGISIDIDISLSFPSQDFSSMDCFNSYNPYMSGQDLGCGIGYCDNGYMPYSGGDYSYGNPYYDPYQQYYQFPDFLGGYNYNPNQSYNTYPPYYGQIPRDPFSPITPPPGTPTYFGCDNIIVMCPTGPVNRPLPTPIFGNIPRNNPPTNYPPNLYPPVYPPNNYPPTHGGPIYPPTTNYPPVNPPPGGNPPVNPPVINQPPVNNPPGGNPPFVGNPPPASNSNSGSRPPVVNTVPRV